MGSLMCFCLYIVPVRFSLIDVTNKIYKIEGLFL